MTTINAIDCKKYLQRNPLENQAEVEEAKQKRSAELKEKEPQSQTGDITKRYPSPMPIAQFLNADFKLTWLADNLLVRGQPAEIGGAYKSLKTWCSLHLAVSLASGQPVFGQFRVKTPVKVLIFSAESGDATLQRNLKALGATEAMPIHVACWVPHVSDDALMGWYLEILADIKPDVVILDPLFLIIDGDAQANVVLNGQQLAKLCETTMTFGATPIIDDHVKRSSQAAKDYSPIQLEDISGAGKAEYFRQWILLGRRSKFVESDDLTKSHELWMTVGGSAGHSSCWALNVNETFTPDYSTVDYSWTLNRASEVRQVRAREQQTKKDRANEAQELRMHRKAEELVKVVFNGDHSLALTKSDIEGRLRVSGKEIGQVLGIVLSDKRLKEVPLSVVKNGRKYDGYMLNDALELTE